MSRIGVLEFSRGETLDIMFEMYDYILENYKEVESFIKTKGCVLVSKQGDRVIGVYDYEKSEIEFDSYMLKYLEDIQRIEELDMLPIALILGCIYSFLRIPSFIQ